MRSFRKLICLTGVLALVCAIPVLAQITNEVNFQAPFAFYAGNAKLPAGNYRVSQLDENDHTVVIESIDGSHSVLLEYEPAESVTPSAKSEITFKKYGNSEFLAAVSVEGEDSSIQFLPSKAEKNASKTADAATHALTAKSGS